MKKYKLICKKGEGTFSEVVKAENVESGNCYAIKCMKTSFDSSKQVSHCTLWHRIHSCFLYAARNYGYRMNRLQSNESIMTAQYWLLLILNLFDVFHLLTLLFLFQVNNLREIQALRRLTPHPNIVNLEEVLYDEPSGRLAMVFELMEQNLYDMISGKCTVLSDAYMS